MDEIKSSPVLASLKMMYATLKPCREKTVTVVKAVHKEHIIWLFDFVDSFIKEITLNPYCFHAHCKVRRSGSF